MNGNEIWTFLLGVPRQSRRYMLAIEFYAQLIKGHHALFRYFHKFECGPNVISEHIREYQDAESLGINPISVAKMSGAVNQNLSFSRARRTENYSMFRGR